MNEKVIPITKQQMDASSLVYRRAAKWKESDKALHQLGQALPDHDFLSVLLKSAAINQFYATRTIDIHAAAKSMSEYLKSKDLSGANPLGARDIPKTEFSDGSKRQLRSFASKCLHFFENENFPILDKFAGSALGMHLGYGMSHYDKGGGYKAFCADFQRLRELSSPHKVSVKQVDIYLWVRGQWESYRTGKQSEINKEIAGIFDRERAYLEQAFEPLRGDSGL